MRLGMNRRIKIRIFPAYTAPIWKQLNKTLALFLVVMTFAMGVAYYYTRICPIVTNIAKQRSMQIINLAMEEVIEEKIAQYGSEYEQYVNIEKGEDGQIRALYMNTREMNRIKSAISTGIQQKIESMGAVTIRVPLGAVLDTQVFAGVGPMIHINLVPIGYALVDFESDFTAAGINQTKHKIDVVIDASFGMILSTGNDNIEVKTSVPLAQTVIVGAVPDMFLNIDSQKQ